MRAVLQAGLPFIAGSLTRSGESIAHPVRLLADTQPASSMIGISSTTEVNASITTLEHLWPMVTASISFLLPLGLLLIFTAIYGSRDTNAIITRAFTSLAVGVACFSAVGLMIAFGESVGGWFGYDPSLLFLLELNHYSLSIAGYHVAMCAIVILLVFIPLARILTFKGHMITAAVVGSLVYPVYTHWVWGAPQNDSFMNPIEGLGFIDHSGITVIHLTSFLFSASALVSTPHFRSQAKLVFDTRRDWDANAIYIIAGTLLMIIGWAGLNVGSLPLFSGLVPMVFHNTITAGVFGALTGGFLARFQKDLPLLAGTIAGMIAGLLFSSAAPELLDVGTATISGVLGTFIYFSARGHFRNSWNTNPLGASLLAYASVAALGCISTAILVPVDALETTSRESQLLAQTLGVLVNAGWVVGCGFTLFSILDRKGLVKKVISSSDMASLEESYYERVVLEQAMEDVLAGKVREARPLEIPHGDDYARLTLQFNELLNRLQSEEDRKAITGPHDTHSADFQKLKVFADGTFEGLVISKNGRILEANKAFVELIGRDEHAITGRPILDFVPPDYIKLTQRALKNTHQAPYQSVVLSSTGERIPVEIRARPLELNGIVFRLSAIRDIRQQRKAEAEILHLAQHDMLTDLPNRTLFRDRFHQAVETRATRADLIAVMMIDLDRFKEINDLYGHPIGDKFIQGVSKRLRSCVGHNDTCARLGGDEFAIVQVNLKTKAEVGLLANRILEILSKPIAVTSDITIRTSASIGVALCPDDGEDPDLLLANADMALYKAKEAGRNTFRFFEPEMEAGVRMRRSIEVDLRKAIQQNDLVLHFQPQARVDDRSIVGYEALLRWTHADKGPISPSDFVPVAEESGLIIPIGRWVLDEACRQAAKWPEKCRVSVNLSPIQFCDEYLLQHVEMSLANSGLEPHRLELEVTESVLVYDDHRALSTLKELKRRGVGIALDDFGTGYSSLSYLRRFPFDRLKIDRSFVSGATSDSGLALIIRSVIEMGQALGMEVIAEGVETEAEFDLLRNEGCDEVQGYLIGRPQELTPDDMLETLHTEAQRKVNANIEALHAVARRLEAFDAPHQARAEPRKLKVTSSA